MYIIDCSTVPVVTNADPAVFTGTTYQHTATYTCSIGYHMSDPTKETITCGATSWDAIEFTCDPNGNVHENYIVKNHISPEKPLWYFATFYQNAFRFADAYFDHFFETVR